MTTINETNTIQSRFECGRLSLLLHSCCCCFLFGSCFAVELVPIALQIFRTIIHKIMISAAVAYVIPNWGDTIKHAILGWFVAGCLGFSLEQNLGYQRWAKIDIESHKLCTGNMALTYATVCSVLRNRELSMYRTYLHNALNGRRIFSSSVFRYGRQKSILTSILEAPRLHWQNFNRTFSVERHLWNVNWSRIKPNFGQNEVAAHSPKTQTIQFKHYEYLIGVRHSNASLMWTKTGIKVIWGSFMSICTVNTLKVNSIIDVWYHFFLVYILNYIFIYIYIWYDTNFR